MMVSRELLAKRLTTKTKLFRHVCVLAACIAFGAVDPAFAISFLDTTQISLFPAQGQIFSVAKGGTLPLEALANAFADIEFTSITSFFANFALEVGLDGHIETSPRQVQLPGAMITQTKHDIFIEGSSPLLPLGVGVHTATAVLRVTTNPAGVDPALGISHNFQIVEHTTEPSSTLLLFGGVLVAGGILRKRFSSPRASNPPRALRPGSQ
jgi:hypothetical protein